ncbi:abortive infection family protein [Janthinobacterium sp. SUN033]|uniref:abortive infection family protein n=1 Tax=Janthinobacterium sp. SUN033 TaxID=3002439 RepID=UPI0025B0466D|nr:abortive infection family protein [Janthinobacterium sp. SUN033]MDN2677677.1 abortive infection family protein [Janthinobacterium sp. SUN033]
MKLSPFTIKYLAKMVSGDTEGWPYRRGPDLVKLFNQYGFRDVYEQGFPTRYIFAEDKLKAISGQVIVKELLKDLLDPRNWMDAQKELKSIDECAAQVNELIKYDNLEMVKDGLYYKARELSGSIITVEVPFRKASDITEIAIEEQIHKCRDKITSGDYDGAITNARSLVETLLTSIEKELDPSAPEPDGDMVRLYTRVRGLLNLDPGRKDISDALKQVLTGLASIIHGLATMRNKMSDAHATSYKPARHHAKLAVNAAKTVADFMFETMAYQKAAGRLKPKQ